MPETPVAYRVVSGEDEEWYEDLSAADAALARRLGVTTGDVAKLRRPITVDPVVVRRADGRWRSRQAWSVRSGSAVARVFEMLHIDESQYDH